MDIKQIARIIFQDKKNYQFIDPVEKEKSFFLFNRRMARGYPDSANALNKSKILKDVALDIWFDVCSNKTRIPNWFEPDWRKIQKSDNILDGYDDMDKFILNHYPKELSELQKIMEIKKPENIEVTKFKKPKK